MTSARTGEWDGLETVLQRRRLILALYGLMVVVAIPGLLRIETDNSPQTFFSRDHLALQRYQRLQLLFGRDRGLRVVVRGPGLWTRPGLQWLAEVERETAGWTGVVGTIGLYGHHRWGGSQWPPEPEAFRGKALSDPLDRAAGWITSDGATATILLVLNKLPASLQNRLLGRLERFIKGAPEGVEARLVGLPVVQRAVDTEVSHFIRVFFPALILLAVSLLAAAFRNASDVLKTLTLAAVCEMVVLGAMGYAGVRLNLILILLVPLLFVISTATAVHILVRFRRLVEEGRDRLEGVVATYHEKGWPVFWTGVTTFAGFFSLTVAEVPPIRAFGIWAGLGIAFLTIACFTLYPSLLATGGLSASTQTTAGAEAWARKRGRSWAGWATGRRKTVFAVFAGTALLLSLGATRLRLDANALNYLRPDNRVRVEMEELEKAGVGTVTAELVLIGGPSVPSFDTPDSLRGLSRLAAEVRANPRALGAVSPGDIVEGALEWIETEPIGSDQSLREAVRRMRETPKMRPLLGAALTRDGHAARVSMLIGMGGFDELEPLFQEAVVQAERFFPDAEIFVTGQYPLVLRAQRSLLATMLLSLALTLAAVTLVFRLLTRSFRLAAMALVPNVWPVVFVLGALGWLGFPLDSSTIMIAAVVLGLAVDDTLHALGAFRMRVRELPPEEAAVAALSQTAPGHILTTLVLSAGFGICAFSSFVPVSRFGLLTASAMMGALAADLCLVPALLAGLAQPHTKRFSAR